MVADLESPVVMVTGATGLLGPAVPRRLGAAARALALVARDRARPAGPGGELNLAVNCWMPGVGELTDAAAAQKVATAVNERWGHIDVLLHLVGGWAGGMAVADLDHDELRDMLDQHLWTTLNIVQEVVPGMVERGHGRVLAVS